MDKRGRVQKCRVKAIVHQKEREARTIPVESQRAAIGEFVAMSRLVVRQSLMVLEAEKMI